MDINKIEEIYGQDIIKEIKENIHDVKENIQYLEQLNFNDIEDIFERYTISFIENPSCFKNKINKLITKIGINYVDTIESDLSLLEELL